MFYLFFFLGFKLQHTMENLNDKKENQKIKESEIAKEALIKLLKITVFMIKKNIAHTHTTTRTLSNLLGVILKMTCSVNSFQLPSLIRTPLL